MAIQAPVIVMDKVFDRAFCDRLVELYEGNGGEQSGFMRDVGGKTTLLHDANHKRRRDHVLVDEQAKKQALLLIRRRVVPEIAKVHQFTATRMERYLVACYSADDGAHFQPHRDNTTLGTAHQRFAVSVNLNEDFDGGEICFPEYGSTSYKPPPGSAVVFSCSLLHAVTRVTAGRRYAFLPFLYDEEAAKLREKNLPFLEEKANN
jgi:predicted 2-oxoglutarate/Fe(II)-dependent dioxygenase YbiX